MCSSPLISIPHRLSPTHLSILKGPVNLFLKFSGIGIALPSSSLPSNLPSSAALDIKRRRSPVKLVRLPCLIFRRCCFLECSRFRKCFGQIFGHSFNKIFGLLLL